MGLWRLSAAANVWISVWNLLPRRKRKEDCLLVSQFAPPWAVNCHRPVLLELLCTVLPIALILSPPFSCKKYINHSFFFTLVPSFHPPSYCFQQDVGLCIQSLLSLSSLPTIFIVVSLPSLPRDNPGSLEETQHMSPMFPPVFSVAISTCHYLVLPCNVLESSSAANFSGANYHIDTFLLILFTHSLIWLTVTVSYG